MSNMYNNLVYLITLDNNSNNDYNIYKIKKTFKKYNYIIVLGNSKKLYFDKLTNILHVNIIDYYENRIKKIMIAIEWIYLNTNYHFIYKIEYSDSFNKYKYLIPDDYMNYDYYCNNIIDLYNYDNTEHSGKCHDKKINDFPYTDLFITNYGNSTCGILLSHKSIKILLDNYNQIVKKLYEDKAIGDFLYNNGILLISPESQKKKKMI